MKILITNHHLLDYTGSEIFTFTLAKFLKNNGHKIIVYSKYIDKLKILFDQEKIRITNNLEDIKNEKFDIAHVHHNINAIEIRYFFPNLPIIFLSHGIVPFLEQPPMIDIGINRFLAVSEEVKQNLIEKNIPEKNITIFRNIFDNSVFKTKKEINNIPQKALVLSSRIDEETEKIIKEACQELKMKCKFIGGRFGIFNQSQVVKEINNADIVFSLGRGAIETMLCERIPIIFDHLGGDGMVTPNNFKELMEYNFSGRKYSKKYSKDELVKEIKLYNPSFGKKLKDLSLKEFNAEIKIKELINIYKNVSKDKINLNKNQKTIIENLYQIIKTVNEYTKNYLNITTIDFLLKENLSLKTYLNTTKQDLNISNQEKEKLQSDLNKIQSSKTYKIWQKFNKIKRLFI